MLFIHKGCRLFQKILQQGHDFYQELAYHTCEGYKWSKLKNKYIGQRCFVVGDGPSILKQDLTLLKNEFVIVTNRFAYHQDFETINPKFYCIVADFIFGGWNNWIDFQPDLYELLNTKAKNAIKVFPFFYRHSINKQKLFSNCEVRYILYDRLERDLPNINRVHLDISRKLIFSGHTVILGACLPLAHYLGFNEIYLLGCDCNYGMKKLGDSPRHFYPWNASMGNLTDEAWFARIQKTWRPNGELIQSYQLMKTAFERTRRKILNATAGGSLEIFPRVKFEDVVK